MSYERENIQRMKGYSSGEQPGQADVIKLNTNENPYPASPAVATALSKLKVEDLRRYPPPLANDFRRTAAEYHGLDIGNIIPTNGGDELLRLLITTFVDPGETIAIAEPSYSLYPVLADIQGCQLARINLSSDWQMGSDYAQELNQHKAKLAFVVNPHAPSGMLTAAAALRDIARQFQGILVIDEAYADFIDPELGYDAVSLLQELENVIILRTMSKGYSLAGLRFAYGIGPSALIAPMLYKTRDSYNTDFISQVLATAALQDRSHAALSWSKVRSERALLSAALTRLGIDCAPSQSNFLLAQLPATDLRYETPEVMAREFYQRLKDDGILVRYFDQPRLRDKLRITIGTPEENQFLMAHINNYMQTS
jgi:histidinol-phosphate aminotransferase